MTAQHAAPRRRWHVLASLRAVIAGVELRLAWWDWAPVQAHWYRQYKRANRKAVRAEMAAANAEPSLIDALLALDDLPPQTPAAPDAGVPDAPATPQAGAEAPVPTFPPSGPGASPDDTVPLRRVRGQHPYPVRRDTWVLTQPPPGSPIGWIPVGRITLQRPDGRITIGEHGHVTVIPATGPLPMVAPSAVPASPIRPFLALVGPEGGDRRLDWTDPVEWLRDRDAARTAIG